MADTGRNTGEASNSPIWSLAKSSNHTLGYEAQGSRVQDFDQEGMQSSRMQCSGERYRSRILIWKGRKWILNGDEALAVAFGSRMEVPGCLKV